MLSSRVSPISFTRHKRHTRFRYFLHFGAKPRTTLNRMDITSGNITRIAAIEKDPPAGVSGLSVSPDGQWIISPQADLQTSRIMIVENFGR